MLYSFSLALVVLAMGVSATWAQQQAPQQTQDQATQPIPAYHSPLASMADNGSAQDTVASAQDLTPDTRSLAGAQDLSLGAPKLSHSFWQPNVNISSTIDSNPLNPMNSVGWTTWTSILGGIDLDRISGNSDLTLNYVGGGSLSNDGSNSNAIVQQLALRDHFTFRRYSISLIDQFGYLPESAFGYGGSYSGIFSGIGQGLQSGLTPNQSILTSQGQRVSNVALGEFDTFLTPRSTITVVGAYGILHYLDNDLQNTNQTTIQVGYNYLLTRKDTIAVIYVFDAFRYSNISQSINSHNFLLSYARRVTGRLAFQISAGPNVSFSNIPISNSSGVPVTTGPSTNATQLFWYLNVNLTYQLRRNLALSGSYSHGVTGGSGVLAGSLTDTVSGNMSRRLTRNMNVAWGTGYSRNSGLALTSPPSTTVQATNQTYNYFYSSVNLSRALGRSAALTVGYQVEYQNSNSLFCITVPCTTSFVRNDITFSLGWRPPPRNF
jgi:hypothetical protein